MKPYPLGFADPAFLGQGATFEPDIDDPNLYGWWSADTHLEAVEDWQVYTVGNRASYQVSKDTRTALGTTNLIPNTLTYEPFYSPTGRAGNLLRYSEDLTQSAWSATSATKNSATLLTFTAQNGRVEQTIPAYWHENSTYVLKMKIRQISGNTTLQLGANGAWSNITITGSAAYYTLSFTSPSASSSFTVGIRDANAAGFGQIEVTEMQVYRSTWATTYAKTTNYRAQGSELNTDATAARSFFFAGTSTLYHNNAGTNTVASPWTGYMTVRIAPWMSPKRLFAMNTEIYDLFISNESVSKGVRMYTTGGTPKLIESGTNWFTDYQWMVLSWQIVNGGTSFIRKNLDAALTASLNSVATQSIASWGGNPADGHYAWFYSTDLLIREAADDAATQEEYIRYFAERCGLTL